MFLRTLILGITTLVLGISCTTPEKVAEPPQSVSETPTARRKKPLKLTEQVKFVGGSFKFKVDPDQKDSGKAP